MLVAEKLRKENIVEYLIYILHIEEVIHKFNYDIRNLEENIIRKYNVSADQYVKIKNWYQSLIIQLKSEDHVRYNHFPFVNRFFEELNDLNLFIVKSDLDEFKEYNEKYHQVRSYIDELAKKLKLDDENEIAVSIQALFIYLALKTKQKEISSQTEEAMELLAGFLKSLAYYHLQVEKGLLKYSSL